MNNYKPAEKETMYFIGITTKKSSIMKVFPKWMEHFNKDVIIEGIDLLHHDTEEKYREVVSFIKNDPNSLGALVTTHKLDLYKASQDLFDHVGEFTQLLGEVSSISKRSDGLYGHAKDPITSGLSYEAIIPKGHFKSTKGSMCILGAGGSSLALTLYLINKSKTTNDVPSTIIITNRSEKRLEEMKNIHASLDYPFTIEYYHCPTTQQNDAVVSALPPGSLVINATGLGKDGPGSPLSEEASFPLNGYVWEFNYRGDLLFLDQANMQKEKRNLKIEDGWVYFIHGWTRVIAEVLHIDIPTEGKEFDQLSDIARVAR